jgi:hypothetical protein
MNEQLSELQRVVTTNHPARPYIILGGLMAGIGLLRNRFSSLAFLAVGGALIFKGCEEMQRVDALHDGNFHGTNG